MAKRKGAESWKIPTEQEVKELYSDSERFAMHQKKIDDVESVNHKKTIEDTYQEKKNNIILVGVVILGIIIAMIIISVIFVFNKGKNDIKATEGNLNRHNQQTEMGFDEEDNPNTAEGTDQYNNNIQPNSEPAVPQGQTYPQQNYPQSQQMPAGPQGQAYPQQQQNYPQDQQMQSYPQGQAYPQGQQMPQENPRRVTSSQE